MSLSLDLIYAEAEKGYSGPRRKSNVLSAICRWERRTTRSRSDSTVEARVVSRVGDSLNLPLIVVVLKKKE